MTAKEWRPLTKAAIDFIILALFFCVVPFCSGQDITQSQQVQLNQTQNLTNARTCDDGCRERAILDLLFSAAGGQNWNQIHDEWKDPNSPICSRQGVKCRSNDGNSGVLELHLQQFGLQGTVPSLIWQMPNLRALGLTHNPVDIDFSGIENAQNLVVLKASFCSIKSIEGIGKASERLSELHLANNQLGGTLPQDIYKLKNLKKLFLNNNRFSGHLSSSVANLSALTELWLWNNSLTGGVPTEMGTMSNLVSLGLNDNRMSGTLPRELENMYSLSKLHLSSQQSQKKFYGELISFARNEFLTEIDLRNNSLSGLLPRSFLDKVSLKDNIEVSLARNKLIGSIPDSWSRFEFLSIDLSGNMITAVPPVLCEKNGWNNGVVGLLDNTCDAILCKPGTFSETGYLKRIGDSCKECPGGVGGAPYFGSVTCLGAREIEEREVLAAFYDASNGTSWVNQENWMTTESVCTWHGIDCGADGSIEKVSLPNNHLKGNGDELSVIFTLPNLKSVDMEGNQVRLDLFKIPRSSKLETLRLSETGLNSIYGVARASNLTVLHITNNEITDIPDELYTMTSLRSIFMSFNAITGTISKNIQYLSNLEELYLFGNSISGPVPPEVGKLSRLTDLILGGNKLSGPLPAQLSSMPNLHQLSLYDQRGSKLISGTVPTFSRSPNLWYFDASNNDLTGTLPDNFMASSTHKNKTIAVYLHNNKISGKIPASLAAFDFLDMNLAGNRIEEIPAELCSKSGWIEGNVGKVGNCSSILCPRGTFNQFGKHKPGKPCVACALLKSIPFLGQSYCETFSSERDALREIYERTRGRSWINSTNWLTGAPICTWFGVLCEDGDFVGVTSIQLESNRLSGTLPTSIWTLPSLQSLQVKGNPALKIRFDGIERAANTLKTLYLSETNLQSFAGISKATSLKDFHLTGIGFKGTFPEEIFELSNSLESLYIAYNQFYGPIPTRFGQMTKLRSLLAFDNDFLSTLPTQLGLLTNLQTIVLSENLIYGQIPTELSTLPNLGTLSVSRVKKSGPRLSGVLPSFERMPSLNSLYLQGNSIGGSIPADFLTSSLSMEVVDLASNFLTGGIPSALKAISSLNIYLQDNEISDIDSDVCKNKDWMDGAVSKFGCNGILCPPKSANQLGRAANDTGGCKKCTHPLSAPFYGSLSCDPHPRERDILMNLYRELRGNKWYRNDFWGSVTSVCDWYGIACIEGRVVEINLRGNNLVGLPGPDLFFLRKLRILWLHSNPISFSFENIGEARNLESLRLDSTRVHSLRGIIAATSLVELDVRYSSIKESFSTEILELPNLRTLLLSGNEIFGPIPPSFSSLPFLMSLQLDSNMLTGKIPHFSENSLLLNINLSNNSITGAVPREIFSSLDDTASPTLNLAQNQLTGVVPEEIGRFSEMRLYLRENKFLGLPRSICSNRKWNGGDVGEYGCDAIMCKPGTSNVYGRRRPGAPCEECVTANYFGSATCEPATSKSTSKRTLTCAAIVTGIALFLIETAQI